MGFTHHGTTMRSRLQGLDCVAGAGRQWEFHTAFLPDIAPKLLDPTDGSAVQEERREGELPSPHRAPLPCSPSCSIPKSCTAVSVP